MYVYVYVYVYKCYSVIDAHTHTTYTMYAYHIALSQELEKNYDALLQMYGEKAEEAEELRLDIQDVKSMYRQQVRE